MRSTRITLVLFLVALAAAGCHKKVPVPTVVALPVPPPPSPAPAPPPAPGPAPTPPPVATPDLVSVVAPLSEADRLFLAGDYEEAAGMYQVFLRNNPTGDQRDQALFYLGLTYVLRPAPGADWQRAVTNFKDLISHYSDSPFRPLAQLIVSLRSDLDQAVADTKQRDQRIKQLATELDRLKKIDADRRKRP
jgi:tetratricopeptide (TPR) repeat protein